MCEFLFNPYADVPRSNSFFIFWVLRLFFNNKRASVTALVPKSHQMRMVLHWAYLFTWGEHWGQLHREKQKWEKPVIQTGWILATVRCMRSSEEHMGYRAPANAYSSNLVPMAAVYQTSFVNARASRQQSPIWNLGFTGKLEEMENFHIFKTLSLLT